jgi:phosphotransferase system enzyme I (PtsI)
VLWGQIQDTDTASEVGAFIDVHAMLLRDDMLAKAPREIIATELCNAEWALTQQMYRLVEQFEQIEDAYLRERKQDVLQVVERVLTVLLGKPGQVQAPASGAADDPGRARPVAGGHDPLQEARVRRVPHRSRRRDVAYGDRRERA